MNLPNELEGIHDPRLEALRAAIIAFKDPGVVGGKLDKLESERIRLLADRSLFDDRDGPVTVGSFVGRVSMTPEWCRFLHALTLHLSPDTVVELGTGAGMSTAAIASALATGSFMWTLDLRPESGELARRLLVRMGARAFIVTGRFEDVFGQVLEEADPVDLLFIDGHHREKPTLRYTEEASLHLSNRAVVIYDDIDWSDEMERAWSQISSQDRWTWAVKLGSVGVCAVR